MKRNVFICPPCGESVAQATKEGQNWKKSLWPLLPRLTAVLPPQGREMSFGFTLIELLVVVLIIGILAAIALPQYRKAVEKSRATQALTLLDAVSRAENIYYLANGKYTTDLAALDIAIPTTVPGFTVQAAKHSWPDDILGQAQTDKISLQLKRDGSLTYYIGFYLNRNAMGRALVFFCSANTDLPYDSTVLGNSDAAKICKVIANGDKGGIISGTPVHWEWDEGGL